MTCHNLYSIKCSVSEYSFNISYYFNIHCSFTAPKSADFTFICESQQISQSQPCWSLQIHLCPTIMSTTSAMTASVATDHIPSNVADLSNHMWIFILNRGDGTLFNTSFILKEDVIEICIWLGHTHPKGILQYSTSESVVLFHTMDELQVMAWGVMKASMLHDEVIRVRTSPPSATHVRAYMAVVNGEPSATQLPPSDGEEEPHLSPSNPHSGGRTPQQLQANLGGLVDDALWQLMEDLCWEVTLWELNTPPGNHPPTPWGNPVGNGDPDVDDQEVTFLKGGWVPPEQPFWSPAPGQPDGGWEPRGQPPHPPVPVQPKKDVGHLINALARGLQLSTPHINTFSSDTMSGKMAVSFKQWYHKVQCVKDHYSASVVRESIIHSLKGAAADMARYMGPTTSVTHMLQNLTIIFGTVALFEMLMQNFYKVTQSNHEKVPSFATRLEGTLNQIRLQCPRWIMDWEVQQYLKDHLFHGVWRHIRDSIHYLYSNPCTMYSQLMFTANKAESENEEAWDKMWARSAVTTEPVDSAAELRNQIARLMDALTRAGQGNSPSSAPNSPRHRGHGRGRTDRNTSSQLTSHNGQTCLGQTTSDFSVSAGHRTGNTGQSQGNAQGSKDSQGSISNKKDHSSPQCFRCQGWGHMAQECATPARSLNQTGGTKGMWPNPPPAAANSKPPVFPPGPQTKTNHTEGSWEERMTRGCPCSFP